MKVEKVFIELDYLDNPEDFFYYYNTSGRFKINYQIHSTFENNVRACDIINRIKAILGKLDYYFTKVGSITDKQKNIYNKCIGYMEEYKKKKKEYYSYKKFYGLLFREYERRYKEVNKEGQLILLDLEEDIKTKIGDNLLNFYLYLRKLNEKINSYSGVSRKLCLKVLNAPNVVTE